VTTASDHARNWNNRYTESETQSAATLRTLPANAIATAVCRDVTNTAHRTKLHTPQILPGFPRRLDTDAVVCNQPCHQSAEHASMEQPANTTVLTHTVAAV